MNPFFRWIDRRVLKRQVAELQSLLAVLASLTQEEIAELVVLATHVRHGMEQEGNDMLNPHSLMLHKPDIALRLVRLIEGYRRNGNQTAASAMMIWAHTMRAAIRGELLPLARQMWRELSRGFPHLQAARDRLALALNTDFDISDATQFPTGFDPRS